MKVRKTTTGYVLRLETGEEIIHALETFAQEHAVGMGAFTIIGAVSHVELGYYTLAEKQYHWKTFDGEFEIISGVGNIGILDGKPLIHLHSTFSGTDFAAFGGHVRSALVAASAEVMVVAGEGTLERKFDEASGLNLWNV